MNPSSPPPPNPAPSLTQRFRKIFFVVLGHFFIGLGILGIFLPLLPTTPFLLLAAACYFRGSPCLYQWLLQHPWFGVYLQNYREGRGIPLRAKILGLLLLWLSLGSSLLFFVHSLPLKILLAFILLGVTSLLLLIPTAKKVGRS